MPQITPTFTIEENAAGFEVFSNGKPLKTPQGSYLIFPNEKSVQKTIKQLKKDSLESPLYRLMSFSIDLQREAIEEELLTHFETDLICYFAPEPSDLAEQQAQHWRPLIAWAEELGITPIQTTQSTAPIEQPETAQKALKQHLQTHSNQKLVSAFVGGKITSSVLIGLALANGEISAEQAHKIAHIDEMYQQKRYGHDEELSKTLQFNKENLEQIEEFLKLI